MSASIDIDQQGTNGNDPTADQRQRKKTDRRYFWSQWERRKCGGESRECKSSCSNNKTLSELQTKAKTKKQFMFTERSVGLVYYIQIRFCHDKKKVGVITTLEWSLGYGQMPGMLCTTEKHEAGAEKPFKSSFKA